MSAEALRAREWFVFDLDGVVYAGADALPGAPEAIAALRAAGKRVAFVTNNSASTPVRIAAKLSALGVPASERDVVSSGDVAATIVASEGRATHVLGSRDLVDMVRGHGGAVVDADLAEQVLIGFDPSFSLTQLAPAMRAVLRGAGTIACNREPRFPSASGLLVPGAGAIVAALEAATGASVSRVVGKPATRLLEELFARHAIARGACVYVGDSEESDVAMAEDAGVASVRIAPNGTVSRARAVFVDIAALAAEITR